MFKILILPALVGSLFPHNFGNTLVQAAINPTTIDPYLYIGGWGSTSEFKNDGVTNTQKGASSVGSGEAWKYKVDILGADINNEDTKWVYENANISILDNISFDFSVNYYDESGNEILKSQNSSALDIYCEDAISGSQLSMLRIWTDSAGGKNGSHSMELYGSGWGDSYGVSYWIEGDASLDSSFHIEFNKESGFLPKLAGNDQGTILNADYAAKMKETLKDVTSVRFRLGGDNGWTKDLTTVLRSFNSQSFALTDGEIIDNVAPKFSNLGIAASLPINEEYTIDVKAIDVLSKDVTYSTEYNGVKSDGLVFTPTKEGEDSVTVYAKDASGNESSKTYNFIGVNNISAPEFIGEVSTIETKTYEYYEDIILDVPSYKDSTGKGTCQLAIKHADDEEYTIIEKNSDNKFVLNVGYDFKEGEYSYKYIATNSAGITESDVKTAVITINKANIADFVELRGSKTVAEYVPSGIRFRTREMYTYPSFGLYDLEKGLDITFQIPYKDYANGVVAPKCFDFKLINAVDSDYSLTYRMWLNQGKAGKDQPTNCVIEMKDENIQDIGECGWMFIGNSEEYVETTFKFDMENYFSSFNNGGAASVANGISDAVTNFFTKAPKAKYYASFTAASDQYSYKQTINETYEYTITKFNGQSLANTNGEFSDVKDAIVEISGKEEVEVNKEETYNIYAHDMFVKDENLTKTYKMVKPDLSEEDITLDEFGDFKYTFTEIGTYKIKASVTGKNGRKVDKEFIINATQEKIPTTITLTGEYPTTLNVNDEVTIIGATYSENVNLEKTSIKIIDMNNKETSVKVGDKYKFTAPGLYTIRYFASDDALPENNTATLDIKINVIDNDSPVVNFTLKENYNINEKVTLKIEATDATALTYQVTITEPDNNVVKINDKSEFEFTFTKAGEYKFEVKVTDLYDHTTKVEAKTTVIDTKVQETESKGCGGEIISTSILTSLLAVAGVVTLAIKKSINKKEKHEN